MLSILSTFDWNFFDNPGSAEMIWKLRLHVDSWKKISKNPQIFIKPFYSFSSPRFMFWNSHKLRLLLFTNTQKHKIYVQCIFLILLNFFSNIIFYFFDKNSKIFVGWLSMSETDAINPSIQMISFKIHKTCYGSNNSC